MPLVTATVTVTTIGIDAGPFTVSDGLGNTYTGVSRATLLSGYTNVFDDATVNITVTSTGACTNSITIPFNAPTPTPPPPTPTPAVTVYTYDVSDLTDVDPGQVCLNPLMQTLYGAEPTVPTLTKLYTGLPFSPATRYVGNGEYYRIRLAGDTQDYAGTIVFNGSVGSVQTC